MFTKQGLALCGIAIVAIAGIIVSMTFSNQIAKLEVATTELQQKLQAILQQIEDAKGELAKQTADTEQKRSAEVKILETAIAAMGKAPVPEDIAKAVLAQDYDRLAESIATALASDPDTANALRGSPADPAEVAKEIITGDSLPALADEVAKNIWETRRRHLLSDPKLIATVAAKVYDEYGSKLFSSVDAEKMALVIARELAKEPTFAALVAVAKER